MPRETREERALRAAAASPQAYCRKVRAEIRRNQLLTGQDPAGRPSRLERLVSYIEDHVFEESLGVRTACRAVGIADTSIAVDLRAYTRYTIDQFIARLRIEAAVHLIVHTQIKILRIGELLGFKTYSTFLRTYKIWTGETPEATQRHKVATSVSFNFGSLSLFLRLGTGVLAPGEARALREGLADLYPEVFGERQEAPPESGTEAVMPVLDAEALERFQAAELWPRLAELSFPEQRKFVRDWNFWTPEPFRFLHRKGREEGRRDRKRGVEVAQLALDCLDGNEKRLGARVHELRAEGWAWFANAQRLDLEFSAAEVSFRRAEDVLDAHDLRDAWVAGLFYLAKGTLRMFQRRHDECLGFFDQALPPFETAGDVHFQVRTLLQRTAALIYASRFADTEPTLRKATVLLEVAADEALSFQIAYAAITSLIQAGDFDRAETHFLMIDDQIAEIEEPVWRHQILWAKAKIDHGLGRLDAAEAKYLEAWRGFQAHDKPHYGALLALDLSLLYSKIGEPAKVLEIAPVIVEFFDSLHLYDETLAALQLLRDAIAKTEVTAGLLRDLRSRWRDPLVTSV